MEPESKKFGRGKIFFMLSGYHAVFQIHALVNLLIFYVNSIWLVAAL